MHKARSLKIADVVEPRRSRYGKDRRYPALRLAGRWLEAAGFSAGSRVVVIVTNGRLFIEPAPTAPTPAKAEALQALRAILGEVLPVEKLSPAARAAERDDWLKVTK